MTKNRCRNSCQNRPFRATALEKNEWPFYTERKQDAKSDEGRREICVSYCRAAEQEAERQRYAEQITRFCEAKGLFPQVMQYDDQERFFETAQKDAPTNAVIALSGVAGLNAAEHLRSLCPACRMIWCSDLDFSLHAFRLRADYFLLEPVSEEAFQRGLNAWIE